MPPVVSDMDKVLTNKGYSVKKSSLGAEELAKIRKELTVKPEGNPKFASAAQPFTLYAESPARIYVPRMWGKAKFGEPQANVVPAGLPLRPELAFTGKPFDYQVAIIDNFIKKGGNGLICVPCGRGKTFMALAIAAKLGLRFLIVVDKEFLMTQWQEEIAQFFPGLRVGIVQGSKAQLDDGVKYDCTICMIQTLLKRDFKPSQFASYGLTVFDECHHLGASYFSQVLLKIQTRYMLGLSATPERDDGLTKVFFWFLGEPLYWEKVREPDSTVKVIPLYYKDDSPGYTNVPTDWLGETSLVHLLGQVVEWEPRTSWLAKKLVEIASDPERKILVLSERKKLLEALDALLVAGGIKTGYYIGGMTPEERDASAKNSQVLLGTYAMASEGMNIKALNCVLLASPRKKIEQSIGRILRQKVEERVRDPIILDCIDSHDVYKGQWAKRRAFYKKCAYVIEGEKKREKVDELAAEAVCQIKLDD